MFLGQRRRWNAVASAPDLDLRFAMLRGGFRLVQPLQPSIVPLVQPPGFLDRNPQHVHFVERNPQRPDRTLQHRGVGDIKDEPLRLQLAAGVARLFLTLLGEIDVAPAGEEVFQIPFALTVPHQHEKTFAHSKLLQISL